MVRNENDSVAASADLEIAKFPSEFQTVIKAGAIVGDIVLNGEIASRKGEFGLALLNIQGYGMGQTIGQPEGVQAEDGRDLTDDEAAMQLKSLAPPEGADGISIPKSLSRPILRWIARMVIENFLN